MPSSTSTAKTDLSAALKQAIEKSGHTNYTLSQLSGPSHTTRHAGPHRAVQFFRSEAVRLLTPLTGRSRGNQDSSDIPRTCRPCLHLCRQPVPPLSRRTWGISAFRWDLFSRPLGGCATGFVMWRRVVRPPFGYRRSDAGRCGFWLVLSKRSTAGRYR